MVYLRFCQKHQVAGFLWKCPEYYRISIEKHRWWSSYFSKFVELLEHLWKAASLRRIQNVVKHLRRRVSRKKKDNSWKLFLQKAPTWCLVRLWILIYRSSHRRYSIKKVDLKNFAKLTGKHLCQSLFFGLQLY